jgi:hypothetical protein
MTTIQDTLSELTIKQSSTYRNMTMFPMVSDGDISLEYLTLDQALDLGIATVREVSAGGSVPELRVENRAEVPVLIVDGEEFVGAKQNRTANLTILVPPYKTVNIPVACVEAGRWHYATDSFVASQRTHFASGRAAKMATVSDSMKRRQSRHADQRQVWDEISAKAERMHAASPTQAMAAIYDRHRTRVEDYVTAFLATDDQIGAIFAIGGGVVGFDLFGRRATLGAMLPKLVRSYAIDAIEWANETPSPPGRRDAEEFLDRVARAEVMSYPAVGLGTDIRLTGSGVTAGGLVVDGSVVHLAAFAAATAGGDEGVQHRGMAAASARARSIRGDRRENIPR